MAEPVPDLRTLAADNPPAAKSTCDHHHYAHHLRGGEPLSIPICTLCGEIGWANIREQLADHRAQVLDEAATAIEAEARDEALAADAIHAGDRDAEQLLREAAALVRCLAATGATASPAPRLEPETMPVVPDKAEDGPGRQKTAEGDALEEESPAWAELLPAPADEYETTTEPTEPAWKVTGWYCRCHNWTWQLVDDERWFPFSPADGLRVDGHAPARSLDDLRSAHPDLTPVAVDDVAALIAERDEARAEGNVLGLAAEKHAEYRAEVMVERDQALERVDTVTHQLRVARIERDEAAVERDRLAATIRRYEPVIEAAKAWRVASNTVEIDNAGNALEDALAALGDDDDQPDEFRPMMGTVTAEDAALVARATGGRIRSQDLPVEFDEFDMTEEEFDAMAARTEPVEVVGSASMLREVDFDPCICSDTTVSAQCVVHGIRPNTDVQISAHPATGAENRTAAQDDLPTVREEAWDHRHPDHDEWVGRTGRCLDHDCPRHAAGTAPGDADLRTPEQWIAAIKPSDRIVDPDGWRGHGAPSWDTPITRAEFLDRFAECTLAPIDPPTGTETGDADVR